GGGLPGFSVAGGGREARGRRAVVGGAGAAAKGRPAAEGCQGAVDASARGLVSTRSARAPRRQRLCRGEGCRDRSEDLPPPHQQVPDSRLTGGAGGPPPQPPTHTPAGASPPQPPFSPPVTSGPS